MKRILSLLAVVCLLVCFNSCECNKKEKEQSSTHCTNMDNQLKIIAEITLKPGAAKAMKPIFEKVIAGSQAEEGNIYYDLHKDISDTTDTKYVMIETWKDQAAIDTHNQTPHFNAFKDTSGDYIESLKVTIVEVVK